MAVDRIKPLKLESPDSGGIETDEFPTSLDVHEDFVDCRGVAIQSDVSNDDAVLISRDASGNLTLKDAVTSLKTLAQLAAGTGMTEEQHRVLDQLVHGLAENYYEEYTYSGGRVTNCTIWETSGKLKKIREEQYDYDGSRVSQVVTIQYDGSGNEVERLTEVYGYTGSRVDSVTATRSVP